MKVTGLTKSWNSDILFKSFSYDFTDQTSVHISGENGLGKTTLLKIFVSLIHPDKGSIDYCGQNLSWCSSFGVGLFPRLTGLENIKMMESILNVRSFIEPWHKFSSFEKALHTPFGQCSEGMKMLLSLFVSSLGSVDILVWDEVLRSLSEHNRKYLEKNWQELTGAKKLIFTSHDDFLKEDCEKIELRR